MEEAKVSSQQPMPQFIDLLGDEEAKSSKSVNVKQDKVTPKNAPIVAESDKSASQPEISEKTSKKSRKKKRSSKNAKSKTNQDRPQDEQSMPWNPESLGEKDG